MFPRIFWLSSILLVGLSAAVDVPFVFDETASGVAGYNSDQLEQAYAASLDLAGVPMVTLATDDEIISFPVTGGGNTIGSTTEKKVMELKRTFEERVDMNNSDVLNKGAILAAPYPGELTVDQISSIYDYLKYGDDVKSGWSYVGDRRGRDYYRYANESLNLGEKADCSGVGDCDDFAILMSALVESVGGTTRIILARNNTTGGHAYTEVYLGNLDASNTQVEEITNWLKEKFDANKIYTHIDTDAKNVWLNLDWGPDEKGNMHPGGPFYLGDKHYIICIRDTLGKTPLKLPEKSNKPPNLISLIPDKTSPQDTGTAVTWIAKAKDLDKDQILYRFFKNDDSATNWSKENKWIWATTNDDAGENQVEVRIRDGKHRGPNKFDDKKIVSFNLTVPNQKSNLNDENISGTNGQPSSFKHEVVEVSAIEVPSQALTQGSDQAVQSESILFAGELLRLKDGYELALKSLDIDGNKIYLELCKDGQIIDSSVIRPPNNVDATYAYSKDKGQADAFQMIKIHFKNSFRGADQNLGTVDSIWQVSESNPSRVILNSNEEITVTSEEPLRLEEGYELALKSLDIDGNKIYLELSKDEQIVDSSVIMPPNNVDATYAYSKNKGQADAFQMIKMHFKNAFRGADQNLGTVDSIWQVSESNPSRVILNSNEEITVTSEEPLRLEEGYELVLKAIDIDGNKAYVELSKYGQIIDSLVIVLCNPKDGQMVDFSVIRPVDSVEATYAYTKDKGQDGAVPFIKIHFKNAFRGADQNHATVDGIWQVSESNPSRVILNSNDAIILTSGVPLILEEGYELAIKSIDLDGNIVYVELSKDGQVVNSFSIRPPNEFDETYTYTTNKGQAGTEQLINIHFKNSFRGADIELATIDQVWQASGVEPVEVEAKGDGK